MKVRYHGPDIGMDGLFDNGVYEVLEIDELTGAFRLIDGNGEDYLCSPVRPKPLCGEYEGGRFKIVKDDNAGTLDKVISG